MASKLKAKSPELTKAKKPQVLISGPAGVGKTWFSLDFPSCYYEDHEGGATQKEYVDKLTKAGGMYFGREEGSLDFKEVINQGKALATERHDFKTVVHDSITKLLATETANEAERMANDGIEDAFGSSKKPAVAGLRKLLNVYTKLDMSVIFIAHQKEEWGIVSGKREAIGTTFDGWEKLAYELDLWIEAYKAGPARKFRVRKSRIKTFEEGRSYDLSYDTFADLYGKATIEREAEPTVLADSEQVSEIVRLVNLLKIDKAEVDKWLTKASANDISELSLDQAAKTLEFLNSKLRGAA